MGNLIQIVSRLIGIVFIAFALFGVSENGENYLIENDLLFSNKVFRTLTGVDDRLPKELEENKNLVEDDSPIFGLLDFTSLIFMVCLTIGMILVSVDVRDLIQILFQALLHKPSKILQDEINIEKSLRKVSDGYYARGGSGLSQSVAVKNLPVWPLVLKQVEIKVPFADIQMMLGNNAALVRKEYDRWIKLTNTVSNFLPSLGVLGTVLGLIKLLFNMDDFSAIGPAMALALMTTFYGLVFSVLLFRPLCMKLEGLKNALMRLYQTANFWLMILDRRKPGFYLEQDYNMNQKKSNQKTK